MESLSSFVLRKMKLRKILMIIFSGCSVLLLCGICNAVMERDPNINEMQNEINPIIQNQQYEVKNNTTVQKTPREIIQEKREKKIRMYSAFFLFIIMAGSFLTDILFIRCPVCSGHIQYGINPEYCRHCGNSFTRKE